MRNRRIIGLALAAAMVAATALHAAEPPFKLREWDRQDVLVAVEAPLGSDAWHAERLWLSHRRHEMVKIPTATRILQAFVAYPDTADKVPVVLMTPEDQGLNHWARDMADQIAALGYVVIVPDFLSGFGPNGGGRESFPDLKSVFAAHSALSSRRDIWLPDMHAWADYGKKLSQANGKLAALGFAWGAGRAFWFATQRNDLSAAYIFYDWSPPAEALASITAPIYGFYAEDDPRVTNSLAATKTAMAAAGKKYEPVMYPGSEHMFIRLGDEPGNTRPGNVAARIQAMARLQLLLSKL